MLYRKIAAILAASVLAVVGVAGAANATGEKPKPTASAELAECRQVKLTFDNPTKWLFAFDYKVDGEPSVKTDQWGELWHVVNVPAGQTVTKLVTFEEDSGSHLVEYRLARGPESDYFFDWKSFDVETTDCQPTQVTTIAPTVTPAECDKLAEIVVPEVEGVVYSSEGETVDAGSYEVGHGVYTLTAAAAEGYALTKGSETEWRLVIEPVPGCEGPAGPQGPEGPQGPAGDPGEDGEDGDSIVAPVPTRIDTGR